MHRWIERIGEIFERGRRFVMHDVWRLGRPGEDIPQGFIIKQVRITILLMRGFVKDMLLLRAAALTFTTALALVPLFAILMYVVRSFDLEENIYRFIAQQVFQGVAQIDPPGMPDSANGNPGASEPVFDPVHTMIEFARRGADPQHLGVWGVIFVITTVFGLIWNIEWSFNQIWGIDRTRSYYRMFTDYLAVMVMLPLLVGGMISVTAMTKVLDLDQHVLTITIWAGKLIVVWLCFSALFLFVPNTRVSYRYALIGGMVSGTLWALASWGYVQFQFGLPRYALLYQTFAQVPLLLMWIYVSWVILLFGAELTFACQNEKTYAMERLASQASHAYREAVGLRAMLEMAGRFDAGLPGLAPASAGERWNVPTRLVNDTLSHLERAGLARQCATIPPTYIPAKPIHRITIGEVIQVLREAGHDPSALREDDALKSLLLEQEEAMHALYARPLSDVIQDQTIREPLGLPTPSPPAPHP